MNSKPPKTSAQKAKFIKPPNTLKLKVGSGGISKDALENAQLAMDMIEIDFSPIAKTLLQSFSSALKKLDSDIREKKPLNKDPAIFPIMQLKANGGMFKYRLVSDVADICLQFMETINAYNEDTMEIIRAHENSLKMIIANDLKGNGGHEGYKLVQELHEACNRYFNKYKAI